MWSYLMARTWNGPTIFGLHLRVQSHRSHDDWPWHFSIWPTYVFWSIFHVVGLDGMWRYLCHQVRSMLTNRNGPIDAKWTQSHRNFPSTMHGIDVEGRAPGSYSNLRDSTVRNRDVWNPTIVVVLFGMKWKFSWSHSIQSGQACDRESETKKVNIGKNKYKAQNSQVVMVVKGILSIKPETVLCIDASDKRRCWPSLNICGLVCINSTGNSQWYEIC